jgi:AGCS family alanine or glycine:cation symporter
MVSAFGIGNTVQANSVATLVHDTFGVSPWWTGAAMTVVTALVILGGIRSIAVVCEWLVPFMAIFYVAGCLIILVMNAAELPATIRLIVTSAFTGQAAVGGFLGAGMREAMRTASRVILERVRPGQRADRRAAAQTPNPSQALVSRRHLLGHRGGVRDDRPGRGQFR